VANETSSKEQTTLSFSSLLDVSLAALSFKKDYLHWYFVTGKTAATVTFAKLARSA